jgi:hypothetical protein
MADNLSFLGNRDTDITLSSLEDPGPAEAPNVQNLPGADKGTRNDPVLLHASGEFYAIFEVIIDPLGRGEENSASPPWLSPRGIRTGASIATGLLKRKPAATSSVISRCTGEARINFRAGLQWAESRNDDPIQRGSPPSVT